MEKQRKGLLFPIQGLAGERGLRVKRRNRERVSFILFTD
jgi:hypothetical protein